MKTAKLSELLRICLFLALTALLAGGCGGVGDMGTPDSPSDLTGFSPNAGPYSIAGNWEVQECEGTGKYNGVGLEIEGIDGEFIVYADGSAGSEQVSVISEDVKMKAETNLGTHETFNIERKLNVSMPVHNNYGYLYEQGLITEYFLLDNHNMLVHRYGSQVVHGNKGEIDLWLSCYRAVWSP